MEKEKVATEINNIVVQFKNHTDSFESGIDTLIKELKKRESEIDARIEYLKSKLN